MDDEWVMGPEAMTCGSQLTVALKQDIEAGVGMNDKPLPPKGSFMRQPEIGDVVECANCPESILYTQPEREDPNWFHTRHVPMGRVRWTFSRQCHRPDHPPTAEPRR